MFDSKKLERMKTDASDLVIDACFNQLYEDMWHSVTYYFRKLLLAKQNYDIHDKKLLAIVAVLKAWRVYTERASELTILTNHKNLLHFITTKELNRRQVRWSKKLEQYKFKILYILEKENDKADAFSRRSDHIETKKSFNHSILKINNDESLSINRHELNAILRILRDESEKFLIKKRKLQISINKIDECIKEHHDESLQRHLGVIKTLQLLRQHCQFPNMRQAVETYVKQCLSY
jgi:hypothetical protein